MQPFYEKGIQVIRNGHSMAEVTSCASAVFSLGWILYESGQVMSHDIHDILQKYQNHIPLLHSPL